MKILVPIKRVVDYAVRVTLKDGAVALDGVKMSINPFDEIALEAALKLREAGQASEVVVVSIGSDAVVEQLRAGLAMGADRAIHITHEGDCAPIAAARALKALVVDEQPRLVLLGKQAIDDDAGQVGPMMAAMLGWPQGTFASDITLSSDAVEVVREVDGGLATHTLTLPAVITADLRLNTPRYPSLPNIMKAKSKPVERRESGVVMCAKTRVTQLAEPPIRSGGVMVESVAALVEKLRNEAKVL